MKEGAERFCEVRERREEGTWRGSSSERPGHGVPEEARQARPWVLAKIPVPMLAMGLTELSAFWDVSSRHRSLQAGGLFVFQTMHKSPSSCASLGKSGEAPQ